MKTLEELKDLKLYKSPFILPVTDEDRRKGSLIFLISPNMDASGRLMSIPYGINKMNIFHSYYLEKQVGYYITEEGKLKFDDSDSVYLTEVSEDDLDEMEEHENE